MRYWFEIWIIIVRRELRFIVSSEVDRGWRNGFSVCQRNSICRESLENVKQKEMNEKGLDILTFFCDSIDNRKRKHYTPKVKCYFLGGTATSVFHQVRQLLCSYL